MTSYPLRHVAMVAVVAAGLLAVAPAANAGHRPDISTGIDQGAPTYHDSGLDPTPYLGWNTFYGLGAGSAAQVKNVANFLVSSGMRDAGYRYVWLDGGWQANPPRDAAGNLAANPTTYPDGMPSLVTYLHGLGLKVGIYTDAGTYDPAHCGLGSGAHSGRPMLLNLCDPVTSAWGNFPATEEAGFAYSYGPLLADSWRTDTDVAFGTPTAGEWPDVLRNMDDNAAHPEANGPGHYNDPDYLIPMRPLASGGLELTQEESTTQLVMWAEMASPLIVGSDPRTLPQAMIDTLDNPEIIAVDQDPLDIQGVRVAGDVYSKVLSGNGQRAVVLLNRTGSAASMTVTFSNAGLTGTVAVRDLRARADLGSFTGSYTATVPAHGTALLKLSGTDLEPGTDIGGSASASPAVVRFDDTHVDTFVRAANGSLAEYDGTQWTNLGRQILGQPAAYGSAGGVIDVFVRGTDNHAYRRTFNGTSWGGWTDLGGTLTDAPTAAYTSPTSWTVFARGADGSVWSRGPTSSWTSIGAPNGQPIYGRPSAVTDANGTYVAVRTSDDQVWWRTADTTGTWSAWTALGGVISGSPTLLATEGRVYLFARASDYTLWQRNFVGGAWGDWFPRGEFASNAFYGSLGAAAGANGSAWVTLRGMDGHVHLTVL